MYDFVQFFSILYNLSNVLCDFVQFLFSFIKLYLNSTKMYLKWRQNDDKVTTMFMEKSNS